MTCYSCKISLEGSKYYPQYGQTYCVGCYEEEFCPTCTRCKQKVTGEQKVTALLVPNSLSFTFFCIEMDMDEHSMAYKLL
jgi:hypothetical protein